MNEDFRNRSTGDMETLFRNLGWEKVKINNFTRAFRRQAVNTLDELTGIRGMDKLCPHLPFSPLRIRKILSDGESRKYLFHTSRGEIVESLLMPGKKGYSLCISLQVGCRMGCLFCGTGTMGFTRNLKTHEILDQIRQVYQNEVFPRRLDCLSFMGMGDPLDNLEASMNALEWASSSWGWEISRHKITFSTSGCLSLAKFLSYKKLPNLAFSLHAPRDKLRRKLMPRAALPLEQLKKELLRYTEITGNRVSIEYCLFQGINDHDHHAMALGEWLRDLPCKVNLLKYNPIPGKRFTSPADERFSAFEAILRARGIDVLHRKSLGTGIKGGCGQLGLEKKE